MINFLWAGMFLAAIAAALWNLAVYQDSGSFSLLTEAIFQNARNAVEICIGLAGILSFWLGMLKLIEEAGIAEKISRKLTPLFKVLMKDIPENSPAISTVVLNMAANFLGLDNAATPMGLKAMEQLQEHNPQKDTASDAKTETWSNVIYMPCTMENNFVPELPKETPDIIYLCLPNNPTGTTITKDELQVWVDYANKNGAVIIYDAAYEAYISEDNVAHTIYECEGAKTCAIELKSFSKNAGFTGVRLGYTVVPKELKCGDVSLNAMWARRHGTKFNGAPYIQQRAGEAVYSEAGKAQLKEQVAYYMNNAKTIKQGLKDAGYTVFGGVNAPYIWLKTPGEMTSWEFFDYLLENANVVGTPGSGFGPSGEGYFRLTAFGSYENTLAALERIKKM